MMRKPAVILAPDIRTPAVTILPAPVRSALGRERARGIGEARPSVRAGATAGPTPPALARVMPDPWTYRP